jgi:hypothetical protein
VLVSGPLAGKTPLSHKTCFTLAQNSKILNRLSIFSTDIGWMEELRRMLEGSLTAIYQDDTTSRRHDAASDGKSDNNFTQLLWSTLSQLREGMVPCRQKRETGHTGTFLRPVLARHVGHKPDTSM